MTQEPYEKRKETNTSFFQYDEATKRYLLCLKKSRWARVVFSVKLHVCENPMCGCTALGFECCPEGQASGRGGDVGALVFTLDTSERQIAASSRDALSPDARSLAEAVMAAFQEMDWRTSHCYLMNVKREQLKKVDLAKLDAHFPPEIMNGEADMVGYTELFPFGKLMDFSLGDAIWLVDDQYCVVGDCNCHAVQLTFLHAHPNSAAEKEIDYEQMPSVFYDYMTGKMNQIIRRPSSSQPTLEKLIETAKSLVPCFDLEVRKRHLQLRDLFLRAKLKAASDVMPKLTSALKVGRNELCPCGSGKKYKKCCGRFGRFETG